jgi:SulP family sulfate permease
MVKNRAINKLFPFLTWLGDITKPGFLKADLIAGVTVAMLLIPQAMAYAQLIKLPVYYGLYSALIPPVMATLFGSFRQLSTGPVAIVALLTVAAVQPLAVAGTPEYLAYVIILSFLVGVIQLIFGFLRLGVILNFISLPVLLGFINAAALIIASSQLGKVFGVSVPKQTYHYETVYVTLKEALLRVHWPTLVMAVIALLIMFVLKRVKPKWPNIIIALIITTLLSWFFRFERVDIIRPVNIVNHTIRAITESQIDFQKEITNLQAQLKFAELALAKTQKEFGDYSERTIDAMTFLSNVKVRVKQRMALDNEERKTLSSLRLQRVVGDIGKANRYFQQGKVPSALKADGIIWKITNTTEDGRIVLHAGGHVVGYVPSGLPSFKVPSIQGISIVKLLIPAIIIAFIGFMEAITISRQMSARTKQRIHLDQELIGQGVSNVSGSFFQCYPVSGSFARSAVNLASGAQSGYSAIFAMLVVLVTLQFLTPILYYTPHATLAAIIIYVVIGLLNFKAIGRTWDVSKKEGLVAILTFIMTLFFAPHLEYGILFGVIMSLGFYLQETMNPRFVEISKLADGSYKSVQRHKLETCKYISIVRFYGSLYFGNTNYLESKLMKKIATKSSLKFIIIDCVSIHHIDASGIDMLELLVEQLEKNQIKLYLTHLRHPVYLAMQRAGVIQRLGDEVIYNDNKTIVEQLEKKLGGNHRKICPLSK